MSWHTKLELNFGVDRPPNLDTVKDAVLGILRHDAISPDAYGNLRDAFVHGEAYFNLVGAYVAQLVLDVAKLLPNARIEARVTGEEFRDTAILLVRGSHIYFRQGTWAYDPHGD